MEGRKEGRKEGSEKKAGRTANDPDVYKLVQSQYQYMRTQMASHSQSFNAASVLDFGLSHRCVALFDFD